jgi:hypothetical protein
MIQIEIEQKMTEPHPQTVFVSPRLRSPSTLLVAPPLPPLNSKIRYVGIIRLIGAARSGESEGDRYNRYIEV